jgi:hypothetical protein
MIEHLKIEMISHTNLKLLESAVNSSLQNGWKRDGHIQAMPIHNEILMVQMMIKDYPEIDNING